MGFGLIRFIGLFDTAHDYIAECSTTYILNWLGFSHVTISAPDKYADMQGKLQYAVR
jgi:hypothetical protein